MNHSTSLVFGGFYRTTEKKFPQEKHFKILRGGGSSHAIVFCGSTFTPSISFLANPKVNNTEISMGGGYNSTVSSSTNMTATIDILACINVMPVDVLLPNLMVKNSAS